MQRNRAGWKGFAGRLTSLIGQNRGCRRGRHRARTLSLEPLERRSLLAVATVSATDGDADEITRDPGTFGIALDAA